MYNIANKRLELERQKEQEAEDKERRLRQEISNNLKSGLIQQKIDK
jgi:hypothetical protein